MLGGAEGEGARGATQLAGQAADRTRRPTSKGGESGGRADEVAVLRRERLATAPRPLRGVRLMFKHIQVSNSFVVYEIIVRVCKLVWPAHFGRPKLCHTQHTCRS